MKNPLFAKVAELRAKADALVKKQIDWHLGEIAKLEGYFGGELGAGGKRRGVNPKILRPEPMIGRIGNNPRKGKRVRRDPEAIKREAQEVADAIKHAGADGLSASGFPKVKIIGSPKVWLKQHAPGFKFKVKGSKSKTRYYAG